jgi:MFS family permease
LPRTLRLRGALKEERAFRLLFLGQALSLIGDRVQPIALAFAVLGLGSATDLGIILAAGAVPFALFAIVGGVVADRVGRRQVMVISDVVRAGVQAATAALILTGSAEVWMLIALSAAYGTSASVFMPAMNGLIPQTVTPARLQEANALLALTRSLGNVLGPTIAGVVIAVSGPGEAIALDAATFVVSAALLLRIVPRELPARAASAGERFLEQLQEGWREVRARPWLRRGLVAMSAYHVFVLPSVFVLGPALAERELNGASSWAMITAAFGIGTIAGNLIALRVPVRRPIFVASIALVFGSLQAVIIGSGLGTYGIAGLEALAGIGVALFFTFWDLSVQEQVPAGAVARVSSYDFALSVGVMPLGLALAGPLADTFGLHTTLVALSALGVLSALAWLATPAVREVRRPVAVEVPATPPGAAGPIAARDTAAADPAGP